jgi:hypothetical protein
MLHGLLLHSAHRRTELDALSLLHRQRTSTASHLALGGGARGAGFDNTIVGTCRPPSGCNDTIFCTSYVLCRLQSGSRLQLVAGLLRAGGLPASTTPSFALCLPLQCCSLAAGSGQLLGCCARRAQALQLRQHHLLREAGSGSPASTTPYSALCGPPFGSRLRPVAGLLHAGGLAGSSDTIFCTLRATVRQSAPAAWQWLHGCCTRGVCRLQQHHLLHSTGHRPAAGSGRLQGCSTWGARLLLLNHLLKMLAAVWQPAPAG